MSKNILIDTTNKIETRIAVTEDGKLDDNDQIIFYGREYCTARGCDGRNCEICKKCYPNRLKPFKAKKP